MNGKSVRDPDLWVDLERDRVEFDGKPVKSPKELTEIVADTTVGKTVKLKFVRDGRMQTTSITLAERPGRVTSETTVRGSRTT